MTNDLKKIPEDKLIFVDIETSRISEELHEDSAEYDVFSWKVRDKDTDMEFPSEEVKEIYKRKAALYTSHSKIVCITCGLINQGKQIVLKTFKGEEKDILRSFVDTMKSGAGLTMVLWSMSFDIPTIRKRFFINKLRDYLPDSLGNDSMKRPWTIKGLIDLMDVYKGISYYNESMNEVAWAMGLPLPKQDMKGSDVSDYYWNGRLAEIIKYNQGDVRTLINLYRVFTDQDIIEDVVVRGEEIVTEDTRSPLEKLYEYNEFTEEIQEEVKKLIGKKKLTKKDKESLHDIILSVYQKKGDKKAEKQNKENEVSSLLLKMLK